MLLLQYFKLSIFLLKFIFKSIDFFIFFRVLTILRFLKLAFEIDDDLIFFFNVPNILYEILDLLVLGR